jgi:Cd2+/Zn2+-exporting ATPase
MQGCKSEFWALSFHKIGSLDVLENVIIRENITISLGVVSLLVISAFLEKINLTVGVIGHKGSTVIVILNGLRLLRFRGK